MEQQIFVSIVVSVLVGGQPRAVFAVEPGVEIDGQGEVLEIKVPVKSRCRWIASSRAVAKPGCRDTVRATKSWSRILR